MRLPLITRIWGPGGGRLMFGDAAVLGLLTAGVIALCVPKTRAGPSTRAEVSVGGVPVASLELTRDGVSEIKGQLGVTRVEVRSGRLRVISSPCPQQMCRHGGWIGAAGEMLVCLPNEVVIRLPGQRSEALDALSR